MEEDRELQAMSQVNAALKDLSEAECYRVMQWAANKYLQNSVPLKLAGPAPAAGAPLGMIDASVVDDTVEDEAEEHDEVQTFATFAEMLDASGASNDTERFLIAAYWLQTVDGDQTWKSFQINKLLKDTGNQIENISNPMRTLSKKPALVVQVSKKSTSNGKGTKVFKLTSEGLKKSVQMLGRQG